jgi:hypothetical protein
MRVASFFQTFERRDGLRKTWRRISHHQMKHEILSSGMKVSRLSAKEMTEEEDEGASFLSHLFVS